MSKELKQESDFKAFFTTCEQQLNRLEQCVHLPEDYTDAGLGQDNNKWDLAEIIDILKFVLEEKNKKTIIENLNKGQSKRWKYTESNLKITIIVKLAPSGRVHLTFDFNSKFLEAKTNKIIAEGSHSKVKRSAELIEGADRIQATVTSSSKKMSEDSLNNRIAEKELLKVILAENPFFTAIIYGDVHDGKKINSTAPRMQMDLYNLIYPSTKEVIDSINKLTKPKLADVLWILFALIRGINILHKKGILHRDFKLANILINKNEYGHWCVYITDPGAAIFEKDLEKDNFMNCTYLYAAYDNPIWYLFAKEFSKVAKTETNFWRVLQSMDYSGYKPFSDIDQDQRQYYPVLSILFDSFFNSKPIKFQKTYAAQKEDIWQLSTILNDLITWFQKENNLLKLPEILQNILDYNNKNILKGREERGSADDLETYFLAQLDRLNDATIWMLFQQQSNYHDIDMPLGSVEQKQGVLSSSSAESIYTPKIFVPLAKQAQLDQTAQFIQALKELRYERLKESKKIETSKVLTFIDKLTQGGDNIKIETDMLTWIIMTLGKRSTHEITHPKNYRVSTQVIEIFKKYSEIAVKQFPAFCKHHGITFQQPQQEFKYCEL